jgi:hypothetical protein
MTYDATSSSSSDDEETCASEAAMNARLRQFKKRVAEKKAKRVEVAEDSQPLRFDKE